MSLRSSFKKLSRKWKKVVLPLTAIAAAPITGGASLALLPAALGGGFSSSIVSGEPDFSTQPVGGFTGVLDTIARDREAKRQADLKREEFDFIKRREELRAISGQAGNNFNPSPGNFSFNPFSDNAGNKIVPQSGAAIPAWVMPVALLLGAALILPAIIRR